MTERIKTELYEQPDAVARIAATAPAALAPFVASLERRTPIVFLARGTSDNAARYGGYLLAVRNARLTSLALPSVVTMYGRDDLYGPDTPVVAISQSGRSPDLVATLTGARRHGSPTLAITNAPDAPLAEAAEHVVDLACGPELAVAATKSYTASLGALVALAHTLDDGAGTEVLPPALVPAMRVAVAATPDPAAVELLRARRRCVVVGRGYQLATAHEAALKLQELTGIMAQALSPADLEHGPIAVLGPGVPLVVIATQGPVVAPATGLMDRARELGAPLVAVSDVAEVLARADVAVELPPDVPEEVAPLVAIVPLQLLAIATARALGLDVDNPRGLAKVTETR